MAYGRSAGLSRRVASAGGGQGYGYGGGRMGGDLGEWRGVSEGMFSSKNFLHSTRHIEMSN